MNGSGSGGNGGGDEFTLTEIHTRYLHAADLHAHLSDQDDDTAASLCYAISALAGQAADLLSDLKEYEG